MNQSVSISLGGRVFYIEEDAYQKLKIYLEQIRISLKNETDKEEIVLDIEHRIAELFTEYLSISRQAINNQDVEKIISTMGNPENFAPESDDESIKPTEKLNESTKKSLFRDYDNKFIAGIIAGISKFIGIETLWLRLGLVFFMILSWWFFDESFILPLALVYIILWVLVPFAKTTSDKLRMEGKQINLDSIKEQFNISEDEKNEIKNTSQKIVNKTSDFLGDFLKIFGKILLVTLGIAFLISGFTLMFGFFLILNGFNSILGDPFNILGEMIYESSKMYYLSLILVALIWLIPAYFLIILGLKILLKKFDNPYFKTFNISLLVIWFFALVGATTLGILTVNQFDKEVQKRKSEVINNTSDTLVVSFNAPQNDSIYTVVNEIDQNLASHLFNIEKDGINKNLKNELEIRQAKDDKFTLELLYLSRGKDTDDAKRNIEKIQYQYKVKGNQLILNSKFYLPKSTRFRDQFVRPILYVPKGKFVKTIGIEHIYNLDLENEDFYDRKTNLFKTENDFLNCIDCGFSNNENSQDAFNEAKHDSLDNIEEAKRDLLQDMEEAKRDAKAEADRIEKEAQKFIESQNKTK